MTFKQGLILVLLCMAFAVGFKLWENNTAKQERCAHYRAVMNNWSPEENSDSDLHEKRGIERIDALHELQAQGCSN